MKLEELPCPGDWDIYDWKAVTDGEDVDNVARTVVTGHRTGEVTLDRIVDVPHIWVSERDLAEIEIVAIVQLTDGWASLTAGCDTSGWGCQASAQWRFAATKGRVIAQGLTNDERDKLGVDREGVPLDQEGTPPVPARERALAALREAAPDHPERILATLEAAGLTVVDQG